jgi:hypothetical protein
VSADAALSTLVSVARALRAVHAPFLVGGSLASSLQGIPRSTLDVDLVADLRRPQVQAFAAHLGGDFYLDEQRIQHAIEHRSSFNVIDLRNGFKADIYLLGADEFSRAQLERATAVEIEPGEIVPFASPEDVILQKLRWYRMGGEVSERQWLDVLGVLKVQRETVDLHYLNVTASQLGVEDLLRRAIQDAGF